MVEECQHFSLLFFVENEQIKGRDYQKCRHEKKIGKKVTHKGVNAVARNHLPKEGGTVRKSIYKDSQDQGTVKNMSKSHWEYNTTLSRHIF